MQNTRQHKTQSKAFSDAFLNELAHGRKKQHLEHSTESHKTFYQRWGAIWVLLGVCCVAMSAVNALANEPANFKVDDDATAAIRVALSGDLEKQSQIKIGKQFAIRTSFEALETPEGIANITDDFQHRIGNANTLDHLMSSYQSQGLKIDRLSAEWVSDIGTFTVGNDWSNFQDLAASNQHNSDYASLLGEKRTAKQITWHSHNGFSVALEQPTNDIAKGDKFEDGEIGNQASHSWRETSPNLIFSWQGQIANQAAHYKLSVLGRKLDLDGEHNNIIDHNKLGWGVKLGGGWYFGDLFAALNVTLGQGIDSFILQRFGRDVVVSQSGQTEAVQSFSIAPRLNYSIGQNSDLQVALERYQFMENEVSDTGIDTLDTINISYVWSSWPSAEFGIEVVGKDFEGTTDKQDSTEIKFGAKKRF